MIEQIQQILVSVDRAHNVGVIAGTTRARFSEFLRNMRTQLTTGRKLSPGQRKYMNDIQKQCDDEAIEDASRWVENYSDELREIAVICAKYYDTHSSTSSHPQYFRLIRRKVLDNPTGHTLSKREFAKMCMNKYAQKVVESTTSEPKFTNGQMVALRTSNRVDLVPVEVTTERRRYYNIHRKAMSGQEVTGIVLQSNAKPVFRSAKDCKVYKLLLVGDTQPIFVCERDIKKNKRS